MLGGGGDVEDSADGAETDVFERGETEHEGADAVQRYSVVGVGVLNVLVHGDPPQPVALGEAPKASVGHVELEGDPRRESVLLRDAGVDVDHLEEGTRLADDAQYLVRSDEVQIERHQVGEAPYLSAPEELVEAAVLVYRRVARGVPQKLVALML